MSVLALFAIGTLALWIGLAMVLAGIARAAAARMNRETKREAAVLTPALGAALTAIGFLLTRPDGREKAWGLPLIWPVMPFWYWVMLFCGFFAISRIIQSFTALSEEERRARMKSAGVWVLVGMAGGAMVKLTGDVRFTLLKGSIPASLPIIVLFAFLAVVAVLSMVSIARNATAAGKAQAFASHSALLLGTVVFGVPFAFLVVTSFKEDKDMSNKNGIVWIPKVEQKVPYLDKKNPLYETTFEGRRVEGTIIEEMPDATVRIDISKPLSIRGTTVVVDRARIKEIPRQIVLVLAEFDGQKRRGKVIENLDDGRKRVEFDSGETRTLLASQVETIREVGLRWENYTEALSFMPPETLGGLVYLKNTLILVVLSVLGTILSSSIVAYAFSRLKFPGREGMFRLMLATLMLPAAVTLLPQFLIFKQLGWIDSLLPLWVPAFFASAFNVFLLRQFFMGVPMELEDAAKMDGCTYLRTFWSVLLPQVKPALAVVAIWTFMGAWNNFMGPLIYVNSPENMPLSYALQLFQSDRGLGEPGLLMAFATLTVLPVLALFFFAQRYFIEGVSLSGLGGR